MRERIETETRRRLVRLFLFLLKEDASLQAIDGIDKKGYKKIDR